MASWVVADMDGTLVGKPGRTSDGDYAAPLLDASPVFEPLVQWLELGGNLLVVTSDDGNWPIRKVWRCLPLKYRTVSSAAAPRRVALCTSDGAALFHGDAEGNLVEDPVYRLTGSGGSVCTLDAATQPAILELAREMFTAFLLDLAAHPLLLESLDSATRKDYTALFERLQEEVDGTREEPVAGWAWSEADLRELVDLNSLMYPGGVKRRGGTVIWRNQAGPTEGWERSGGATATGDRGEDFISLCDPDCLAPYTNLFLLGFPASHSPPYIQRFRAELEDLGVSASAAPNSVCIKNAAVDKATPLKWLIDADSPAAQVYDFRPGGTGLCLAFGDNPGGNDRPLANFAAGSPEVAAGAKAVLPFVSVASAVDDVPGWLRAAHVGGEEKGMAAVLRQMVAVLQEGGGAAAVADGGVAMAERARATASRL